MPNLKNITDLPVVESADGLNLIVEDNGSAKRIAIDAIGGGADWNAKEGEPGYVKNRTHWSEVGTSTRTHNFTGGILSMFPPFSVCDTVTVTVDGTEYSLVAYEEQGCPHIGDTWDTLDAGNGEYGWCIYIYGNYVWFYATEKHKVTYFAENVHRLDQKYMYHKTVELYINTGYNDIHYVYNRYGEALSANTVYSLMPDDDGGTDDVTCSFILYDMTNGVDYQVVALVYGEYLSFYIIDPTNSGIPTVYYTSEYVEAAPPV